MSQAGKMYLVVFLLIGLVVGAGVGWVVKPVPAGWVSQEQYDTLQNQLNSAATERDNALARAAAAEASLAGTEAELSGTLMQVDIMKIMGTVDAGAPVVVESTLTGTVRLGGLFSLSGVLATYGENEYTAALLAAEHVNEFLEKIGVGWRVEIVAEDTQTKPDICLEKVESYAARGIKLLIGPLSSAEVTAIKGYCDANKMIAISQSSTAPDLAIPDDYIFRFCPTDKLGQGPAIARILYEDGKRYIIPITRNDAWGVGLEEATAKRFEELGGTMLEGIRYAPEVEEFSAEASDLASKVSSAVAEYGTDELCVLDISFEEVNPLFIAATEYDVLTTVKWYGSDGTCASDAMIKDPAVLDFTMKVEYPSTIFAPTESAKWEVVRQNGIKVLGREPESYSYAIYDIVWAYSLSILKTDSTNPEAIKAVLPQIAGSFFGASGWIDLDEAGDRKAGDYVIWQIVETTPGKYEWKVVGKYILATDSVEWY